MLRRALGVSVSLVQLIALFDAHIAIAQGTAARPPERPFTGLFNAARPQQDSPDSLVFTASLSEAYDIDLVGSAQSTAGSVAPKKGAYSRVSSQLKYAKRGRRAVFNSSGGLSLDFYPQLSAEISQPIDSYNGSAGLELQLGRATLRASQKINYQPYFGFDPVLSNLSSPVDTTSVNAGARTDSALFDKPTISYGTSVGLGIQFDRRSTLTMGYSYGGAVRSDFWPTINSHGGNVHFGRSIRRNFQVTTQYAYQLATYESPFVAKTTFNSHLLMGGLVYSRPLSRTRTITLSGSAGESIETDPLTDTGQFRTIAANAGLGVQFARSWSAHAAYARSPQLIQGLRRPYFADSVTFGLSGQPSRRLEFGLDGSFLTGDSRNEERTGLESGTFSATLQYALSRNLAVSAGYLRSQYDFGPDAVLPLGVPRRVNRDVFRFSLNFGTMLRGR